MRFQLDVAAVLQLGVSLVAGQLAYDANTNTVHCPAAKGTYCVDVGPTKSVSKMVQCAGGVIVRTTDCNDLLDGKLGEYGGAVCYETSKKAGDAVCLFNDAHHILVPHGLPATTVTEEVSATIMGETSTRTASCAETTTVTVVDDDEDDAFMKFPNVEASSTIVSFVSESFDTYLPKSITSDDHLVTTADITTTNKETKATTDPQSLADVIPDPISPEEPTIQTETRLFPSPSDEPTYTILPIDPTFTILPTDAEPTFTILPTDSEPPYTILSSTNVQANQHIPTPVAAIKTVTVYAGKGTTTSHGTGSTDTAKNSARKSAVSRIKAYLFGVLALVIGMIQGDD